MNLNNIKTQEKKAMRKLYGSIAAIVLAVLVLAGGTTVVRGQNFIPYPTLSLRNFHVHPGDGNLRVPISGVDQYFLLPVWVWNAVDTTQNPNNSWISEGKSGSPGQHLEPIRSFDFQISYNVGGMELDTAHGSPVVMIGPSIVSASQGVNCSVTAHPDTGLAATFLINVAEINANNPEDQDQRYIRVAAASSVPLPKNNSADTGYSEHNGILFWLRFHVTGQYPGLVSIDSARFNDHWGDTGYTAENGGLPINIGNFGGGQGVGGPFNRGEVDVTYITPPVFELSPIPNFALVDGAGGPVDSLINDLVYDPTVFNGSVTQEFLMDAFQSSGAGSEFDNITITSDQPWLAINCGGPGGGNSLTLGWDAIDNYVLGLSTEGPTAISLWLTVPNPQQLPAGVYYATVTFQCAGASNSPFQLKVRFVREQAPDEPTPGGTGIQLQISNSCVNGVTDYLTFGTGPGATDSIDELFGEHLVTNGDVISAEAADSAFAYFVPLDPNLIQALQLNNDAGYTRDIRDSSTDSTLIYQVNFNPGSVNCYPVKVCVDPTQFPAGARVLLKFTLNGSDQGIDLRNATQLNGLECVTINDHNISTFYIEYTPGTIANIATFLKQNSWSLVSLPVIPPDPSSTVIFSNALTTPYQYQSSSGWEQQATLEFGRGYMVRYGSYIGTNSIVAGTKSFSVSHVQISEGWNSIGGTSGTGTFDGSDGTQMTFTQQPGGPVPTRLPYMWEFTPQSGYDMTNFFIPGRGYFIKVDQPGFYNLQTPLSAAQGNYPAGKATQARETLQGQLTQVLFNDAEGNGQVLYFGNATTDQPESNFEMPGMFNSFDARFASNNGAVSMNHASYVVNVHSSSYPVTMKFTNVSGPVTVTDMNGTLIGTAVNNGFVTISDPGITQVQIAEKQGDAPSVAGYALEANTPNPFTQTSTINFSLPQESVVSLLVYNQLGEVVQTLVNATVGAGDHQVVFDGSQLPAGAYYYTLKAGNFVQTQRMTLEH
jgi:hypothetical protein